MLSPNDFVRYNREISNYVCWQTANVRFNLIVKCLILENEQIKTKTILMHGSGINILISVQT